MGTSEAITIIVGGVNLIALLIVAWQAYLTRKAVRISEQSLKDSEQSRFISSLPRAYSIIHVKTCLENWKKDLELLINSENTIIKNIKSGNDCKVDVEHWHGKPQGLIHERDYAHLPDWLKEILVTGAQYYTEPMCLLAIVESSENKEDFRLNIAEGMFYRSKQGLQCINEMLTLIARLIPKWYLESPASLEDREFFDKP